MQSLEYVGIQGLTSELKGYHQPWKQDVWTKKRRESTQNNNEVKMSIFCYKDFS